MLVQTGTAAAGDELGAERTPPDRRVPERPVFVDASGRRQRRVRRIGRILVVPAVAYIGLLVSTLLGGPTINSPFLPLPSAPHAGQGGATGSGTQGSTTGTTSGTTAGTGTGAGTGAGARTGTAAGTGAGTGTQTTAGTGTSAKPSALPSVTTSPSAVVTHGHSTHTATPSRRPTKKATSSPT